ncbi:MAG: hypothetical protein ACI4EG_08865 [Fusicatenibacter sp.]|nr:hypothetical protein [Fusicatenibacter sp.]
MKEFVSSALPLIMTGVALAILAVNYSMEKRNNKTWNAKIAAGAGLGLVLGVLLNQCGLWENHVLGLVLGPLWGMALGSFCRNEH